MVNVVVLKTSEILVTVAQVLVVGHKVGHEFGQLALWVRVIVVTTGGTKKSIVVVEVIVLKMSVVLTTVGQVDVVGHEVGHLVGITVVEVTVDREHEDGSVGHEYGPECELE